MISWDYQTCKLPPQRSSMHGQSSAEISCPPKRTWWTGDSTPYFIQSQCPHPPGQSLGSVQADVLAGINTPAWWHTTHLQYRSPPPPPPLEQFDLAWLSRKCRKTRFVGTYGHHDTTSLPMMLNFLAVQRFHIFPILFCMLNIEQSQSVWRFSRPVSAGFPPVSCLASFPT
jgi:hypothetical protein